MPPSVPLWLSVERKAVEDGLQRRLEEKVERRYKPNREGLVGQARLDLLSDQLGHPGAGHGDIELLVTAFVRPRQQHESDPCTKATLAEHHHCLAHRAE